jgi:hypothetical protein
VSSSSPGNYCTLYHISGSPLTVGSPHEARRTVEAVNHITELLLDFTDMQSAFGISITVVLVVSKDWRENSFERNSRDKLFRVSECRHYFKMNLQISRTGVAVL